ncbi:SDR family NAD(P)-dependent oxidoreductase [Pontibacter roseus]|uniref:SDR family NAD(P)-dependent oxidoreductase n=1 Tax=Pontibacter roseus TaxID=336989 RepID=UPI00036C13FB|nr:SDR family oxidoreductase [Pontibacter roseus]
MIQFDFSGKLALVTGGSSGLGFATAKALAEHGATVLIASRSQTKSQAAIEKIDGEVHFIQADMSEMADVHHLFDEINTRYGRLDIAINNAAGESGIGKPLSRFEEAEFDNTINTNLKSVWLCMKREIELMQQHPEAGGHIVNVSSVNGLGGVEYGSIYAATKAGVIALAKSAALELVGTNIMVDVLVPGAFDTPLLQKAMETQTGGDPDKLLLIRQQYEQLIPKGRIGYPEEFASTIMWICSGKSPYMSGHTFIIDGGMSSRMR